MNTSASDRGYSTAGPESGGAGHALARAGWLLALLAALLTLLPLAIRAPHVSSDPAMGILAAEHYLAGRSPSIRYVSEPSAQNLKLDVSAIVSWWAPGYQALPWIFRRSGMDLGQAIRLSAALSWAAGAAAWFIYFRLVCGRERARLLPWVTFAFLCFQYSHEDSHIYTGGERLAWCGFPLALLASLYAASAPPGGRSPLRAALVGAASSSLVLLKYSLALSLAGLAAGWCVCCMRLGVPWRRALAWLCGAGAGAATLAILGIPGGPTPASYEGPSDGALRALTWALSFWPLAISDVASLVSWGRGRPGLPSGGLLDPRSSALALTALLAVCFLSAGSGRDPLPPGRDPRRAIAGLFAWSGLATVCLLLFALKTRGAAIDYQPRHFHPMAISLLPFLALRCADLLRPRMGLLRTLAGSLCAIVFLVAPALKGLHLLRTRLPSSLASNAGSGGLRLPALGAGGDGRGLYREIEANLPRERAVLYLTLPGLALPIARRRVIVRMADVLPIEMLRSTIYRGFPRAGVGLLLPRSYEDNGRGDAIRASFVDVPAWRKVELSSTRYWELWLGEASLT